jgi:prephenate dehydratase
MSKQRIVFQGEPGANSHLAISEAYPRAEAVPCATFEDCFAAVRLGRAELAMIPIENSVAGRVADIHHLMPTSKLHIVAEHFMPVHHQLLAVKGSSLKTLKTVESHIHALGQCRNVIRKLGIKAVVAADTAGSAREVSEACDKTRFIILSRTEKWARPKPKQKVVTTFIFQVRNIPAALYKALGGFATNGINMTKLESYMIGGNFAATQFYADVEGHPDERALELALQELDFVCQPGTFKILGVYPAHPFRKKLDLRSGA